MKHHHPFHTPAIIMMAGVAVAGAEVAGDAKTLNAEALTAMEAGKWEEALQLFDRCVAAHGTDALKKFGPSFGVTWYRKGICEMQLKRPEAAAKSFETCYRDFPNNGKAAENLYNKRALIRWGEAAQAMGNHAEAIRLFTKFLAERDKSKEPFEPGSFYIQLALCHLACGDLAQGAENLETAVRNRKGFATPDSGIVAALQSLVAASAAKKEAAALTAFLEKNKGSLLIAPFEMATYAPAFVRMATDAMGASMDQAALDLFLLIPPSEKISAALKAKIEEMGAQASVTEGNRTLVKSDLQATLDALDKSVRDGTCHEAIQLGATAVIRERQGDLQAAYQACEQLEVRFPHAKDRETYLFNVVRAGAAIGEPAAAAKYGPQFLETYPDSKQVPAVRRLMLVSLFRAGNHEACIKVASELMPKLTEGTQDHDACLHILAASYEQSDRFDDARPLLDRHATLYPQSPFAQATLYYQASNRVHLEQWDEAAKLLDALAGRYPDPAANPYHVLALVDRARCHAAKAEDAAALEKIGLIQDGFPDAPVVAAALGLKGDLLLKQDKPGEAETCYKQSLEKAETAGNRPAAAEALARLAGLLSGMGKDRAKEAAGYCDRFWKNYSDLSPARTKIIVLQPSILENAGRTQEALDRLRTTIVETSANPSDPSLEPAIREYARIFASKQGAEALNQHFRDFQGIRPDDKVTRSLLRIAVITVVESQLGQGDDAEKAKADALMKSLFQELKSEFGPKDLPAGILVRMGDFLRLKTSAPRQALPYYEEVLARADVAVRFPALLGKATVLAEGSKEEREAAIKDLESIFADSPDALDKEEALYWLVMTKMKAGDFAGAGNSAERYLAHDSGYHLHVPEVRLALAGSYQERNMVSEALSAHERVWRDHEAVSRVSNQAMRSWMLLSWARQTPAKDGTRSDRQAAYEEGAAFLDRTRPFYNKMVSFDQETWLEIEKLVAEYGGSTDVKKVVKASPPPEE
ncbi:tetratricopeptide repeat protein [Luteolibacter luteus]|uniref:Tetratricopeptide repeat protein n=1 Tax=Luteolibacter luteus TaxID=2728835 RepID=A0A858RJZ9_9BACT|nr:tetratricopeptide repeat protein [Luteolibacter luteus]QJE96729.1 tetratricopeptide repeat protein [Luteolibacter luteus]